jgi:predicted Fe-Mo cluster-binding NifX family protein
MKIAIPLYQGKLSMHFGHCQEFAIVDTEVQNEGSFETQFLVPPAHEPGVLPKWLHSLGVDLIIAGGIGQRAQQLFNQNQIEVVVGAPSLTPKELADAYLNKTLTTGDNTCDH